MDGDQRIWRVNNLTEVLSGQTLVGKKVTLASGINNLLLITDSIQNCNHKWTHLARCCFHQASLFFLLLFLLWRGLFLFLWCLISLFSLTVKLQWPCWSPPQPHCFCILLWQVRCCIRSIPVPLWLWWAKTRQTVIKYLVREEKHWLHKGNLLFGKIKARSNVPMWCVSPQVYRGLLISAWGQDWVQGVEMPRIAKCRWPKLTSNRQRAVRRHGMMEVRQVSQTSCLFVLSALQNPVSVLWLQNQLLVWINFMAQVTWIYFLMQTKRYSKALFYLCSNLQNMLKYSQIDFSGK